MGGSGGQGVVLAAKVLGEAAVLEGKFALQTQAYGAEARGSLTKSEVIISDGRINFPAVRQCDYLVTMNQDSTDALIGTLKEGGTLIVDGSNVPHALRRGRIVHSLPLTETARKGMGDPFFANMVMLGALVKLSGAVSLASLEEAIRTKTSAKWAESNARAVRLGFSLPAEGAPQP